MCRMLAVTGRYKNMKELLIAFQKLSLNGKSPDHKGHTDGWGIGYYARSVNLVKKGECAATSKDYQKVVHRLEHELPHIVLAHVRKASPLTHISDKEAHPFLKDTYLFCHNGSIYHLINNPQVEKLDSIVFFEKILTTSFEDAVHEVSKGDYSSLTCVLTDGATVWGYRDFTEREDYYTLYYLKEKDYVLICSEPLIKGDWVLLENHQLVTVSSNLQLDTKMLL